jgi:hypothetical protein
MPGHSQPSNGAGSPIRVVRIAAIRHIEMVGQLSTLQVVVSSVVHFVLRRLSTEAFSVDVVDEILTDFWE